MPYDNGVVPYTACVVCGEPVESEHEDTCVPCIQELAESCGCGGAGECSGCVHL